VDALEAIAVPLPPALGKLKNIPEAELQSIVACKVYKLPGILLPVNVML